MYLFSFIYYNSLYPSFSRLLFTHTYTYTQIHTYTHIYMHTCTHVQARIIFQIRFNVVFIKANLFLWKIFLYRHLRCIFIFFHFLFLCICFWKRCSFTNFLPEFILCSIAMINYVNISNSRSNISNPFTVASFICCSFFVLINPFLIILSWPQLYNRTIARWS